jgi:ParB/RepB/Spo0J family partition protein
MLSHVPTTRRRPAAPARFQPVTPSSQPAAEIRRIPLDQIDIPPARIRRELGSIQDLAYSVGSVGLLHPVQVYRVRNRYRLIAGERRLQAARMLSWTEIDAMVREPSGNHLLLELIENTQRKWLTDVEEADAMIRLVRELGHEAKEVAGQAGRSEAYVSKRIRVFEDAALREAVEREQLSVSVVEEFLALPADERSAMVARAVAEEWDGRRAREAVRGRLEPPVESLAPAEDGVDGSAELAPLLALLRGNVDDPDADDESARRASRRRVASRTSELAQQVRGLNALLSQVRPFELTPADQRALVALLQTLLRLARAHAGPGRSGIVFPSIEEAERKARRH